MYDTEQEQIEAIKNWWSANGNYVIGAVLAALIGYFGWNYYQGATEARQAEASMVYDNLLEMVQSGDGSAQERSDLIETLKTEYSDTTYAVYGALQAAKNAVEEDDLSAALTELEWALDQADDSLRPVVQVRIARVQFADGQPDAALATLEGVGTEGYEVVVNELKGDVLASQGDVEAARSAYQTAFEQSQEQGINSPYLKMKLDELTDPTDDA